jgi:hypothetical protein
MTCEHRTIGGAHAIICGRRVKASRCGFCQRTSTKLCDAIVGKTLGGAELTCDEPICDGHARPVAPNKDFCPKHSA